MQPRQMKPTAALLLLLALCAQCGHSFELRKFLHLDKRNLFKDLNEYLIAKTDSPEPSENFRLIKEKLLMDSELAAKDKEFVAFARHFLELEQITDENLCSHESLNILARLMDYLSKTLDKGDNPLEFVARQAPGSERPVTQLVELLKRYKWFCWNDAALKWHGQLLPFAEPTESADGATAEPQLVSPANRPAPTQAQAGELPVVYKADDGYAELDHFLRAKVKTLDLGENIREAQALLKNEKEFLRKNPAARAAIEQFVSLKRITPDNMCDKKSADLANEVFEAVGRRYLGKNPFKFPKSRKRVGEVVTFFFYQRALACLERYAREWDKKIDKFATSQLQADLYVYKASVAKHGWCFHKPGRVLTGEVEELDCAIQRSFDHQLDQLEDLNPIVSTFKELLEEPQPEAQQHGVVDSIMSDRKLIERHLESLIYSHCRALMKSKNAEALEKTFKTLLTVELSDNLFRAARKHDPQQEELFRNLINWTTSYGNCLRLLESDRRVIVENLYALSHQDVDQLLRETLVQFEDFPPTMRLSAAA